MKRALIVLGLLVSATVTATPIYHPAGPNLTYGEISNGQTIISNITNPAAGAVILKSGENEYRFGLLSSFGTGLELGDVDNLFTELDAAVLEMQQLQTGFTTGTASEIETLLNNINGITSAIQDDGNIKAFSSIHLPLMPLVLTHSGIGGSIALDVNASVVANFTVLADPINFDAALAQSYIDDPTTIPGFPGSTTVQIGDVNLIVDAVTPANSTFDVDNDSVLVLKAAGTAEIALGYSRALLKHGSSQLFGGVRGKFYQVELLRSIVAVDSTVDTQATFDNITSQARSSETGTGLDLGLLWVNQNFRLGATMSNINEPSFSYNAISGTDIPAGITKPNIVNALATDETYTMETQLKLEGALYTASQNWVLGVSYDANPIKDPVGAEYQWATFSAAYASRSIFLPGLRMGYRKNMAGTELSYASAGLTLFSVFNLDLAYGLEEIQYEGESYPRSFMVNLGLEMSF